MHQKPLKIVADDKIPLIETLFADHGNILLKPGRLINNYDLRDAQILLTRTITSINDQLLNNTAVQFVGSATAGFDHAALDDIQKLNIVFAHAAGCNSIAVANYVQHCIAALRSQKLFHPPHQRAAVIGVGHAGSAVAHCLRHLNFEVLEYDPPRAERDPTFHSAPLNALTDLDLICIHTPLTHSGPHPTHHFITENFLREQKQGCVLLNAGRGGVIDTKVLLRLKHLIYCIDVWENEPNINLELLDRCTIATPHIAGYSLQAKRRATLQLYTQAQKHFDLPPTDTDQFLDPPIKATDNKSILELYNPIKHTSEFKKVMQYNPQCFESLRREYPLRNELTF